MRNTFEWKMIFIFCLLCMLAAGAIYLDNRVLAVHMDQGCHMVTQEMTPVVPTPEVALDGKVRIIMKSRLREYWRCPDGTTFTQTR